MKKLFALLGLLIISQSLFGQNKKAYASLKGGVLREDGRLHYNEVYYATSYDRDSLICIGPGYELGIFSSPGIVRSKEGELFQKIFNEAIIAVSDYILETKELSGVLEIEIRDRKVRIEFSNGQYTGEASMYIEILD